MDGILDWYLLGVVTGLGVAEGTAGLGMRRRRLFLLASVATALAAIAIVALALPLWALVLFAAAGVVTRFALRRLSVDALPAAFLAAAAIAALPALGYLLAGATPVVGARLGRKGSRYAGLRILAKD